MARGAQVRQEWRDQTTSWQILAFRLDRFTDDGRPLPSIPVEMRGLRLFGHINDGEWIEVPDTRKKGELLQADRVRNLTTDSWIETRGTGLRVAQVLFRIVVLLAFAVFLLWGFYQFTHGMGRP